MNYGFYNYSLSALHHTDYNISRGDVCAYGRVMSRIGVKRIKRIVVQRRDGLKTSAGGNDLNDGLLLTSVLTSTSTSS